MNKIAEANQKKNAFTLWRKEVFMPKLQESLYYSLGLDYYNGSEYEAELKKCTLNALRYFSQRNRHLRKCSSII